MAALGIFLLKKYIRKSREYNRKYKYRKVSKRICRIYKNIRSISSFLFLYTTSLGSKKLVENYVVHEQARSSNSANSSVHVTDFFFNFFLCNLKFQREMNDIPNLSNRIKIMCFRLVIKLRSAGWIDLGFN